MRLDRSPAIVQLVGREMERGEVGLDRALTNGRRIKMRKQIAMMIALVVVLVPLVAAAAFAADQIIQCRSNPCYGSGNYDLVYERVGNHKNDTIYLRGGNDRVQANAYTRDTDVVKGGWGHDKIDVEDNDKRDLAGGGKGGHDWCIVDSRAEVGSGCERVTVQ